MTDTEYKADVSARLARAKAENRAARKAYAAALDSGNAHRIQQAKIRHMRAMDSVECHAAMLVD